MPQEHIRVAVIGAGIVGLTLAVALDVFDQRAKIAIDIYEASPQLSEVGAGINVWPRTWHVLSRIGMADTLLPLLDHYPDLNPRITFEIRKADQKDGFKIIDVIKNGGALRIHRADLQRSLLQHLGSSSQCTLHLSHRLVDYTESPTGVTLHFANGKSVTHDLLVGADGIKSTVRQLFLARLPNPEKYQACLNPVWTGMVVYRGLVDREALEREFPGHRMLHDHPGVIYAGRNKHVVVYPVSGGKFINVVAGNHDGSKAGTVWDGPWNTEVLQQELLEKFSGWEEEFQALLRCIKRPTKWALQKLNLADTFAKDRVLLIGDSAHAMEPHQGAGAGIGIEDAYVLATLLVRAGGTSINISRLLEIYNTIRIPRAKFMSETSNKQGYLLSLDAPGFERYCEGDDIPKDMLVELFRVVQKNWDWSTGDPEEDRQKAIRALL